MHPLLAILCAAATVSNLLPQQEGLPEFQTLPTSQGDSEAIILTELKLAKPFASETENLVLYVHIDADNYPALERTTHHAIVSGRGLEPVPLVPVGENYGLPINLEIVLVAVPNDASEQLLDDLGVLIELGGGIAIGRLAPGASLSGLFVGSASGLGLSAGVDSLKAFLKKGRVIDFALESTQRLRASRLLYSHNGQFSVTAAPLANAYSYPEPTSDDLLDLQLHPWMDNALSIGSARVAADRGNSRIEFEIRAGPWASYVCNRDSSCAIQMRISDESGRRLTSKNPTYNHGGTTIINYELSLAEIQQGGRKSTYLSIALDEIGLRPGTTRLRLMLVNKLFDSEPQSQVFRFTCSLSNRSGAKPECSRL